MIEVGGRPILWHIMKIYSHYGFNDFIICLGYKGYWIKEYFAHYFLHESDVTFDFRMSNQQFIHNHKAEPWKVTLVDTGMNTMTGGRVKRVQDYIGNDPFMLTYGDGVSNVDIPKLVEYHKSHGKLATITSVQPTGRYGALNLDDHDIVQGFQEKPRGDGGWVNGGFFVMQPEVLDFIDGDHIILEREPLERLAAERQLAAYKHYEFWQAMDTMRDKELLEHLWKSDQAPWKVWE